jgi:hypothetical protein
MGGKDRAMGSLGSFLRAAARLVETCKGAMASLVLWLSGVWFFGMAYCMTGGRTVGDDEVVAFMSAFAWAAALAPVTALAVAGRTRWALVAMAGFAIFALTMAGLSFALPWPVPSLGRPGSGAASFPSTPLWRSIGRVAEAAIVAGVFMGVGLGLVAGLLILLARRWPRLIGWLMAGILVACVTRSAHIDAFDHVAQYAMTTRIGREPGFYPAARIELPSAMGACAGAVVGAAGAWAVLWWADRRRTAAGSGRSRPAPGISPRPDPSCREPGDRGMAG